MCNVKTSTKSNDYFFLTGKKYQMTSCFIYIYTTICKDAIWVLSPKVKKIQAQRAQYNEFVENELENQAIMSFVAIIVDPNDDKVKIDWFSLKKIVIGTV